ncbi:MAG: pseudouridine synthase [Polyangiaceae bacterium]
MQERLQKIIAKAGLSSRRAAEELVTAGRVRVNGRVVTELGAKADARVDRIEVDGKRLVAEDLVYVVMHKPKNVVSTMSDPEGRPTVAEYLRDVPGRAYPVGRLDFATSGVLLATNDGEFANGLLHPKTAVPKTYVVKVQGVMTDDTFLAWKKGVMLEDGKTLPADVKLIRYEADKTWFEVTLREGRNQQVRRMGEATGHRVMRLARVSFAGITAENLRPGEKRALTRDELLKLRETYGVPRKVRGPTDLAGPPRRRNERVAKNTLDPAPETPRGRSGSGRRPAAARSERTGRTGTRPRGAG